MERAQSFGTVAETYDRARPRPADAAVDWLVPPGATDALDLAAGTGLLTRRLATRVEHVVAVEPDDRMRAVLAARSPGVTARAGTADAIPLPDASVDVVTVSSAWHWFDPETAFPEIARVLRPGGRLSVIWTGRDTTVDWVAALSSLTPPRAGAGAHHRFVPAAPFTAAEDATFSTLQPSTVDAVVEQLSTYSGMLVADAGDRAASQTRVRDHLTARFPDGTLLLPVRSHCFRTQLGPAAR